MTTNAASLDLKQEDLGPALEKLTAAQAVRLRVVPLRIEDEELIFATDLPDERITRVIALLTGLSFGNGVPLGTFTVTRIGTGSAMAIPSLGPAALGLLWAVLAGVTAWTLGRPPGAQA